MVRLKDHSYEEVRDAVVQILAGKHVLPHSIDQYEGLRLCTAHILARLEGTDERRGVELSPRDNESFLEIFWDLFRQGVITLGLNNANREFPFFRISHVGRRMLSTEGAYFFYDVDTYTRIVKASIPDIHDTALLYLQEAMQAFKAGCVLSATVMVGVAAEHTFLLLMQAAADSPVHGARYKVVEKERTILQKITKFQNLLQQDLKQIPTHIREDLETNFLGILAMVRNVRNQSGHPTGKIVPREQAYVLLQLYTPYAEKLYALRSWFLDDGSAN